MVQCFFMIPSVLVMDTKHGEIAAFTVTVPQGAVLFERRLQRFKSLFPFLSGFELR